MILASIPERLPNWIVPTDPKAQFKINLVLAATWLLFGFFGLVDFLWEIPGWGIADSVPILFFISVYANFVGHLSAAQAVHVEISENEGVSDDAS